MGLKQRGSLLSNPNSPARPTKGLHILPISLKSEEEDGTSTTTTTNTMSLRLQSLSPKNILSNTNLLSKDEACMVLALSILGLWIFCLGGFNFYSGNVGAKNILRGAIQIEGASQRAVQVGQVLEYFHHSSQQEEEPISSISIQIHFQHSQLDSLSSNTKNKIQIHFQHSQLDSLSSNTKNKTRKAEEKILVLSPGSHSVTAYDILSQDRPQVPTLRIIGDAVIPIPLQWDSTGQWMGTFHLPSMDGSYQLEAEWFGCVLYRDSCTTRQISNSIYFEVQGSDQWASSLVPTVSSVIIPTWSHTPTLFPSTSAWVAVDHIPSYPKSASKEKSEPQQQPPQQQYAWVDMNYYRKSKNKKPKNDNDDDRWIMANDRRDAISNERSTSTMISLASTVQTSTQQAWFDTFRELSNYELVCWMGGPTAEALHANFKSMREELFARQRPFKFHYYPMTNLQQPDETWEQDWKEKFRKCKHILVVMDDDCFMEERPNKKKKDQKQQRPQPLSSDAYRDQVERFLKHLVRAFPDSTFPIWIFTIAMEPPHRAKYETRHCYQDMTPGGGGSDGHHRHHGSNAKVHNLQHPCNEVLFDLFRQKDTLFASKHVDRIRLLDNTDLSMAGLFLGDHDKTSITATTTTTTTTTKLYQHPRKQDILAVIAFRIYVIVGKQVQEWRSLGQIGLIDGLHHNETVEANFDLIPYQWN